MKILLHSCCAPCTIYPLEQLVEAGHQVEVLFYNPNIHPYTEYRNRKNCLEKYLNEQKIPLHIPREYDLNEYFREVVFNEDSRCTHCYQLRLSYLFCYAQECGFDGATTTLLYSRYQNHSLMCSISEREASKNSVNFIYSDFRQGWEYGIEKSKEMSMYRQTYCGCLYSEQERYDNRLKKRLRKLAQSKKEK